MNEMQPWRDRRSDGPRSDHEQVLNALPTPVVVVGADDRVTYANAAAEAFLEVSLAFLRRHKLADFLPFGSPVATLIGSVRERDASVSEHRIEIALPRSGVERVADLFAAPFAEEPGAVILMFQERTIADKMDRQLTHRGAARSITALGAMLAHEIKNPLSGIRGAAQLLEGSVDDADRELTRLIRDETDRIVKLVNQMELFAEDRPAERAPVNIHTVLEHVKKIAISGFARHIRVTETYDPSLPPVHANRDQLIQVFLNLIKNSAEAIGPDATDGEIELTTAFRPGVKVRVPGAAGRVSLPLEFCVRDNGSGVPPDLMQHLFDPFVTTKTNGSGLGLALVAKVVRDHGGVIECDSAARRTTFRILMPMFAAHDGRALRS